MVINVSCNLFRWCKFFFDAFFLTGLKNNASAQSMYLKPCSFSIGRTPYLALQWQLRLLLSSVCGSLLSFFMTHTWLWWKSTIFQIFNKDSAFLHHYHNNDHHPRWKYSFSFTIWLKGRSSFRSSHLFFSLFFCLFFFFHYHNSYPIGQWHNVGDFMKYFSSNNTFRG